MFSRHLILPALLAGLVAGCESPGGPGTDDGKLRVLCTTSIVADAVSRVGGDHVAVDTLMGPGIDPHRYAPTGGDARKLSDARLVFHNGLHLEGKMADVLDKPGRGVAVAVTKTLDPSTDLRPAEIAEAGAGAHDPHVWFDVRLWMKAVACVRDELVAADPAHADAFRANADAYLKELDALDREVKETVGKLPKEKRVLVTSHDAFGYFGRAYGFEVRGVQGVSTAGETNTKEIDDLARFLGTRKIPAVFGETSVPTTGLQKVLDTVRSDHKFEVRLVGDGDALYSDALGEPGTPGGTYPGMIRHNVNVIVGALSK